MNLKLSLPLTLITAQTLMITHAYGNSTVSLKSISFYAGLSGGFNGMAGRRSENVFAEGPPPETISFTDNTHFKDNNAQYSGFLGASWAFPQIGIFLGPEFHLGKTHTEQRMMGGIVSPPVAPDERTLKSIIAQSSYWGGAAKIGYTYTSYSGYVVLGCEASQFQNYMTYVPLANVPADPIIDSQSRKWLKGFLWGFGLEKQVNRVKFGIEARFINYGTYRTIYSSPATDETINVTFKPKNMRLSIRLSYVL